MAFNIKELLIVTQELNVGLNEMLFVTEKMIVVWTEMDIDWRESLFD